MTDYQEQQLAYRIRQELHRGCETLDDETLKRLKTARLASLSQQRHPIMSLSLAGVSRNVVMAAYPLRVLAMTMTLSLGVVGSYYWHQFDQATENEEIDSALLTDELPPEAYIDRGFHTWLERSSQSSSQ